MNKSFFTLKNLSITTSTCVALHASVFPILILYTFPVINGSSWTSSHCSLLSNFAVCPLIITVYPQIVQFFHQSYSLASEPFNDLVAQLGNVKK